MIKVSLSADRVCIIQFMQIESGTIFNQYRILSAIGKGGTGEAFAALEKAYQQRDWFLLRLRTDPFMDSLRDDPRFNDLLKRMNLPE